jgi:ubiquinone/menaquinone biosynthesis C-methylase UbiE
MENDFFGFCKGLIDNNFINVEIQDMYGHRFSRFYDSFVPEDTELEYFKFICMKYGSSTLELGCGSGRLTIPLAQAGIDIEGIDSSPHMLELLEKKAAGLNCGIKVYKDDFKHFQSTRKYNAIIMPVHTIQLINDRISLLNTIKRNLIEGGVFAFTYVDYEASEKNTISDRVISFDKSKLSFCIMEERIYLEHDKTIVNLYLEDVLKDGVVKRYLSAVKKNILPKKIFNNELIFTGFRVLEKSIFNFKGHKVVFEAIQAI